MEMSKEMVKGRRLELDAVTHQKKMRYVVYLVFHHSLSCNIGFNCDCSTTIKCYNLACHDPNRRLCGSQKQ
nr:hypothetical protein [Tanacetum cinerariifolium]